MLGKHLGAFTDRMILSEDQSATDEQLVQVLSRGDKKKAAVLRGMLAPDGFPPLAEPEPE